MTVADLEQLYALARACAISVEYWDYAGHPQQVSVATIAAILASLEVPAENDQQVAASLEQIKQRDWQQLLPPCVVMRQNKDKEVWVHVPHGESVSTHIDFENGGRLDLAQLDHYFEPRQIGECLIGRATFHLPAALPLGYHTLVADLGNGTWDKTTLIVTPDTLGGQCVPNRRHWGVMAQLYSVRSHQSWGLGDTNDLEELTALCAGAGADFVLINPIHSSGPLDPFTASPYLPATRRFVSPLYIRPEDIPEVAYLGPQRRRAVEALRQATCRDPEGRLDRDQAWRHKVAALEIIHESKQTLVRQRAYQDFCQSQGSELDDFALWCALVEIHGADLPPELAHKNCPAVSKARRDLAQRVELYRWMQWIAQEQFANAQVTAKSVGMNIGIVHDLAVGVLPKGSEVWSAPERFATGIGVGAPPDMFNQLGQNWSEPPWRPRALESLAYAPLRNVVRTALRMGGALRIDHIMGLFRLWWIPQGFAASAGAYVNYDHEAMVGVILLEAQRAGGILIGEDLGVVEPWVRTYLSQRGILGTSVLWFEKNYDGDPLPPAQYRKLALATVNTHDLPPTAGYLEQVHIKLGKELGLFGTPLEQMTQIATSERERMLAMLMHLGLLDSQANEQDIIEALHRYICLTPCLMVAATLVDGVGEHRPQNFPGTDREYPNWQVPLGDETDKSLFLEDLHNNARLHGLFQVMEDTINP